MRTPKNKIAYLYEEDINLFLDKELALKEGVAYEWEDEGVVHLRTQPSHHGYGHRLFNRLRHHRCRPRRPSHHHDSRCHGGSDNHDDFH